jgi:hypothetical protein
MKHREAWKGNLVHQVKCGRPLTLAASLIRVGMDKVIFEKNRDPEFAKALEEAKGNHLRKLSY